MASDPNHNPNVQRDPQEVWKDIKLTRARIGELIEQGKMDGDLRPAQAALEDLQLKTSNYERLLEEMQAAMKAVLGKNFLGTAEWEKGFGVKVGRPPPIPESITPELLNSLCPLHPGQLIKDTHILLLLPKTVDGQPYSALKLDELCSSRKGSGERLIGDRNDLLIMWKTQPWANLSQAQSEWVLLPKRDPDPDKVSKDKHFRWKKIEQQEKVYKHYEAEYREAKALEVMTMALLNDLMNGKPRILDGWNYLRCPEPNTSGGRICVGLFSAAGLAVNAIDANDSGDLLGFALARRLRP